MKVLFLKGDLLYSFVVQVCLFHLVIIRKFPENKLELMEYYSFILFEKWLYMDSLDNISEANKIYYEIKAIADELSKDYADNQVTQMLSMGIVRKL